MNEVFKIKGSYYHKPAVAIIESLPQGARLLLRPEPSNPHDRYAIRIMIRKEDIPLSPVLEEKLAGFGFFLEDIAKEDEWFLGYVPKDKAALLSAQINGESALAELCFAPNGDAQVRRIWE